MPHDDEDHDPERWRSIRPYNQFKPITFVAAGSSNMFATPAHPTTTDGAAIAAQYLQLVGITPSNPSSTTLTKTCDTCGLEVHPGHELLLAHQAAQPHSHPPHHLPRSNVGLKIMTTRMGWDADARVGLGAREEGRRWPVTATEKRDRIGVGGRGEGKGKGGVREREREREKKVGVREARKEEVRKKRKREAIMHEMRDGVDVNAYLRGDGGGRDGISDSGLR